VLDRQAVLVEQAMKVIERQLRHALDVFERCRQRRIVDFDPLEECLSRAPAGEPVDDLAAGHFLARDQVLLDVMRVQVVDDQLAAAGQRRRDVRNHARMIVSIFKVSEAREQAEHEIEGVRAKRLPHVLFEVAHVGAAMRSRARQAAGREIQAGDAEAAGGEASRVTPTTATEVEHPRTASGLESIDQPVDKRAGFRLIAV
jgi:hypothetical protein